MTVLHVRNVLDDVAEQDDLVRRVAGAAGHFFADVAYIDVAVQMMCMRLHAIRVISMPSIRVVHCGR